MTLRKTLLLLAATTCLASPTFAGQENAEERIRMSVKLKLLSQAISAQACQQQFGIKNAEQKLMPQEIADFDRILTALTVGDADMNIAEPEERKKTLRAASRVGEAWAPVKAAAENVANGNADAAQVDQILVENLHVLENGHDFTAELVQQYANPAEATLADLFTIVIATRQGMLSQKMSKEACMAAYMDDAASKKLAETMQVFEATLYALRDGMPGTGIEAAPTKDIKAGLEDVLSAWAVAKPILEEIQNGGDVTADRMTTSAEQLNAIRDKMLDVSSLYVAHTKKSHPQS